MTNKPSYEELEVIVQKQKKEIKSLRSKKRREDIYLNISQVVYESITKDFNLDNILRTILDGAGEVIGSDNGFLHLYDKNKGYLQFKIGTGKLSLAEQKKFILQPGEGLAGTVFQTGKPIIIDDYYNSEYKVGGNLFDGLRGAIAVPLKIGEEIIGVYGLAYFDDKKFSEEDLKWLEDYASIASLAIDFSSNAQDKILSEKRAIESENRALESEKRLSDLINNIQDVIFRLDTEGKLLYLSSPVKEILGYEPEEMIGKHFLDYIHPEDQEILKIKFQERLDGSIEPFSYRVRRKDGTYAYVSSKTGLVSDNGKPTLLGTVSDITELKALEKRLKEAEKMQAIATLAGGVSHNYNNLLMGMQGHLDLMRISIGKECQLVKHLEKLGISIESAAKLTRQLLGFSMGGKYDIKPSNLNDIINSSLGYITGTKVNLDMESNLWKVNLDNTQIRLVLENIYDNAIRSMDSSGEIYISTTNVYLDDRFTRPYGLDPGGYVKISVRDNGEGMSKETKERIFEPFFSTKNMGSTRGTGLGLASSYSIIKNHEGIIEVESEKGKGTTFNIYLPRLKQNIEDKVDTILLVDDDPSIIDVGRAMIQSLGYNVITASSGKEAISIYDEQRQNIGLTILDIFMDEQDGKETYLKIQNLDPYAKVLFATGYATPEIEEDLLKQGTLGILKKPFSLKVLGEHVKDALQS